MIVPFLDPPTPLCPSSHRGAITFVLRLFFFLYAYWMNRIRIMTSLHKLLNSMTTLLHSLSNIFIQYLLTIHNNDLVVACRRVWGVLSRVKCTLRALDRATPHPSFYNYQGDGAPCSQHTCHYLLRLRNRFFMPVAKSISGWTTPCPASISLSLIISVFLRSSTIALVSYAA